MKAQLIYAPSIESTLIYSLLKECKDKEGNPLEITLTRSTKKEAFHKIDDTCPVLLFSGFAFSEQEDYYVKNYVELQGNVPFVDFYIIGSMVDLPHIEGVTIIKPMSVNRTTISETYRAFLGNKGLFTFQGTENLIRNVDIASQYLRYTFKSSQDYSLALNLIHLQNALGASLGDVLTEYTIDDIVQQPIYSQIVQQGSEDINYYVNQQAQTVTWKMIPLDSQGTDYLTLGVAHGSRYKNELAHFLLGLGTPNKRAVVILEEKFDTIMTIRTLNYDAVQLARMIDPNAGGLPTATTVFARLDNKVDQVATALEQTILGGIE